jgi:heptosyltransferase-2
MAERDAQVIINAAPSERPVAREVAEAMSRRPMLSFHERDNTIGLLKGLVRRCDLLVTNDTGARHFGAAFGIGVVTLFGSTDPVWAQIDYPNERIVRVDVPCSPCQRKVCPNPPGEEFHRCMRAITVDAVASACNDVLARCQEGSQTP